MCDLVTYEQQDGVLAADILLVRTPTWAGHMSSIASRVVERLDAELSETDAAGNPTSLAIGAGAAYTVENVTLSGGVRYTFLGDAQPETGTPDTARGTFEDNSALSAGLQVGFRF